MRTTVLNHIARIRLWLKATVVAGAIVFSCPCYGQTIAEIKKILHDLRLPSIEAYGRKDNVQANWQILREVLPGYQEGVVTIEEIIAEGEIIDINNVNNYRIELLANGQSIFYYRFTMTKFRRKGQDDWTSYDSTLAALKDPEQYAAFSDAFRSAYQADLEPNDLFQKVVYGNACGITGEPTKEGRIMDSLVRNNDKMAILAWLQSANTEKQLYGFSGILSLMKTGYLPTAQETKLMRLIGQKKGMVHTCGGCLLSADSIKNVIAAMAANNSYYADLQERVASEGALLYIGLAGLLLLAIVGFFYRKRRNSKSNPL
jgi:LPXTG-motif cell wall-anchored protein